MFDDYLLFRKKRSWWLLKDSPLLVRASELKVRMVGMKAFQKIGDYVKPTTRLIQAIGHMANRAILDIHEEDLQHMAGGEPFPADMGIDNGYVIISLKGSILGLGLLIDGAVRSQIPREEIRPPRALPNT